MRFMATCPEATEAACRFITILEPGDYKGDPKIMRKLINDSIAHGKSVFIPNYRTVTNGVKFNATSLEENLHVWSETLVDVQGESRTFYPDTQVLR